MPEWDPDGGQAPREIEIESRDLDFSGLDPDLDFSGLEEADLMNVCFPSAAVGIKTAAPVDTGWPYWSAGLQVDNCGLAMTAIPTEVQSTPPDLYSSDQTLSYSTEAITPPDIRDTAMTDLMRADLDQVFFDRVHPVLPIIYHRRYFSWADMEHPGATRVCLRSAMRAMAAAMSAPGRRFCDQLYAETCHLLEAHKIGSKADISVEYIQAWLLLAHYELLRVGEYQAMLTAGRCLRLVLMARLADIDSPGPDGVDYSQASPVLINRENVRGDTFANVEEQRRVFWLSFCLDRSLCLRNEYPLTLQEDMVSASPWHSSGIRIEVKPSVADHDPQSVDLRPPPCSRSELPKQPIHPYHFPTRSHISPAKHPTPIQLRRIHPRRNPPRPLPSPSTLPPFPRTHHKPRRYQPNLLATTKTPRPGRRHPPPRARHLARVRPPRLRPHAPVRPHARPQRRHPARPRRAALAVPRGLVLRRQTGHHCLIPEPGPERRRRDGPSGTADPVFQCRPRAPVPTRPDRVRGRVSYQPHYYHCCCQGGRDGSDSGRGRYPGSAEAVEGHAG